MKKKALIAGLGVLIVLALAAENVRAAVIRVPGPNPSNPAIIQQAINSALSGDTVSVAAGIYDLTGPIKMKDGVSLIGAGPGVSILVGAPGETVIICDNIKNLNKNTTIEGFTIAHLVTNAATFTFGRGICCKNNSSPTIRNNFITGNTAKWGGGGISCENNSSPTIDSNIITGNTAKTLVIYYCTEAADSSQGGGGILCKDSSPTIKNNYIIKNSVYSEIPEHWVGGGGISCYNSSPIIENNVIRENYTYVRKEENLENLVGGGGILCVGSSLEIIIKSNTITDNITETRGGGISCYYTSSTSSRNIIIANNIIARNSAGLYGGGISCDTSIPTTITNNTITNNTASTDGSGGNFCNNSFAYIANNIITNNNTTDPNGGGIFRGDTSSLTIDYNDVYGNTPYQYVSCIPGTNDISVDPLFVNLDTIDYHLQLGSSCVDKGNNSAQGLEGIASDLDGNSRIFNDVVDMGAYEYSIPTYYYTITPIASSNGTILPPTPITVNSGRSPVFTIIPDPGYYIVDVKVDGVSVGAVSSYTFNYVDANHTVEATFAINTNVYTITTSAGPNGTILPSGPVTVNYGGKLFFTIIPYLGYHIVDVIVDRVFSKGAVSSYTFYNVNADHTIEATFAINTYTIMASAESGGTILPSGIITVNYGEDCVFNIAPAPAKDYRIADVKVDGASKEAVSSYTFSKVVADHTIEATFIKTYTITATAGSGGTISPPGEVSVNQGANKDFTITANPGYKISDVVVDDSSVGPVSTYPFTNVTSTHTISATFAVMTYTITATAGSGGSITPSATVSVDHGMDQAFTIAPDTDYHVADVLVDGGSVGAVKTYTFTNVIAAHTISATFKINTCTLSINTIGTGSGTVSLNPPGGEYNSGTVVTLTATPAENSKFEGWSGDLSGTQNPATITMNGNKTVTATFNVTTCTITPSAGPGGTISPSEPITVEKHGSCVFTITPDPGYRIAHVTVDDRSMGRLSSYTFRNIRADHTINASFIKTYTITASAGPGGTIHPSGVVTVNYGRRRKFHIEPDRGYYIDNVKVDGVSVGQLSSYTFRKVDADHTIQATFAKNEVLSAVVDIDPNTLELKSRSGQNAITAYIELPKRYDVAHIIVATVKLDVYGTTVAAQFFPSWVDDYDHDRVPDLMVKFDRQEVIRALAGRTGDVTLTVSGQLIGGMTFSGKDTIRVK